jgi:hypothetical protein
MSGHELVTRAALASGPSSTFAFHLIVTSGTMAISDLTNQASCRRRLIKPAVEGGFDGPVGQGLARVALHLLGKFVAAREIFCCAVNRG